MSESAFFGVLKALRGKYSDTYLRCLNNRRGCIRSIFGRTDLLLDCFLAQHALGCLLLNSISNFINMGGGGHDERRLPSQKELEINQVPLAYRDYCSDLLIPLNKCRQQTHHMPWSCSHERHAYEKCAYDEYQKSVAKMKQARKDAKKAALAEWGTSGAILDRLCMYFQRCFAR